MTYLLVLKEYFPDESSLSKSNTSEILNKFLSYQQKEDPKFKKNTISIYKQSYKIGELNISINPVISKKTSQDNVSRKIDKRSRELLLFGYIDEFDKNNLKKISVDTFPYSKNKNKQKINYNIKGHKFDFYLKLNINQKFEVKKISFFILNNYEKIKLSAKISKNDPSSKNLNDINFKLTIHKDNKKIYTVNSIQSLKNRLSNLTPLISNLFKFGNIEKILNKPNGSKNNLLSDNIKIDTRKGIFPVSNLLKDFFNHNKASLKKIKKRSFFIHLIEIKAYHFGKISIYLDQEGDLIFLKGFSDIILMAEHLLALVKYK